MAFAQEYIGVRMRRVMKIIAFILSITLIGTGPFPNVLAADHNVFRDVRPDLVFELVLQFDDGADYRHYAYIDVQQGVCDLSRPVNRRECQIDLIKIIHQFKRVAVINHVTELPSTVQWKSWDWNTMTSKEGGYTPIILAAEIKEWEPESNRVRHWWLACSVIPDTPTLAVCREVDIVDPTDDALVRETVTIGSIMDYVIVRADELLALPGIVAPQTADNSGDQTDQGIGGLMDQVYG